MPRIGIATCGEIPELEIDEQPFAAALTASGAEAVPVVWSDSAIDWSSFDAVVIRATWDYSTRLDEFLAWARGVESVSRLFNPSSIVHWNTDKHYLAELSAAGIATVPTLFVEPGEQPSFAGLEEFVVKPAVSCGSRDTMRYIAAEAGAAPEEHVQRLLAQQRSVMIQPYLPAVDTIGESALIFIGGEYSHSIRKGQMLRPGVPGDRVAGLYVKEPIDPRTATDEEIEVARRVLAAVPGGSEALLYARVDLIPDQAGRPVLLELELTEPSLFFSYTSGAAERMVEVLLSRL